MQTDDGDRSGANETTPQDNKEFVELQLRLLARVHEVAQRIKARIQTTLGEPPEEPPLTV
ncbi:unnamed protein product [Gemmata massiliana]|uniref:Uncharacterized protein n=1 Tax=Gemmata massiliana TaxID=1210884 RepID=A0A6P2DNF5_9BACT|nr:hypothetical protein [Gemmata massiliana]VTS03596.1 unnamed protein product [Gemmata massiliana]